MMEEDRYEDGKPIVLHCRAKVKCKANTVDGKFFGGKIFLVVKFLPGFIFIAITTRQYKLTPFIR